MGPRPDQGELRGLKLGLNAATMSTDKWGEFACGSNGGPPRQRIFDWSEFAKCRAEDNDLHEVYARFDDENDYVGRATDDPVTLGRVGTRVAGHPIVLSVLFDRDGILRGLRFVSDPRGDPAARRMAHLLRLAIIDGDTREAHRHANGQTVGVATRLQGTVSSVDLTQTPPLLTINGQTYTVNQIKAIVS